MDEWRDIWALNIAVARRRKKWSQRKLAAELKVTQASVGRWETAASVPTDAHKLRIAEVLEDDVRALFPLARGAAR